MHLSARLLSAAILLAVSLANANGSGGGPAAVIRTNHSVEGSGYSLWWEPARSGTPGAWSHAHTASLNGVLGMRREGETLRFYFADIQNGAEGSIDEIGTVHYGTSPITKVEFWVTVPETESPVDVTFDDISVAADRILDQSTPAESPIGPRAWFAVLAIGVVALAAASWRIFRTSLLRQ